MTDIDIQRRERENERMTRARANNISVFAIADRGRRRSRVRNVTHVTRTITPLIQRGMDLTGNRGFAVACKQASVIFLQDIYAFSFFLQFICFATVVTMLVRVSDAAPIRLQLFIRKSHHCKVKISENFPCHPQIYSHLCKTATSRYKLLDRP